VVRRVTSFEGEPIRWDRRFESRSLQERVYKLSVPRAPIAGARGVRDL